MYYSFPGRLILVMKFGFMEKKNSGKESKGLIKKINKKVYKELETIGELTGISKYPTSCFEKCVIITAKRSASQIISTMKNVFRIYVINTK